MKTWPTGALVVTLSILAIASLAWMALRDPKINFLPRDERAEWILFPRAMDSGAHHTADLDTVFRREFAINDQPRAARLDLRAAKRAEVTINGAPVAIAAAHNWKDVASADLSAFLRTGSNSIEVKVFNNNAPAALWLTMTADQLSLRSDETWEASCAGSAWRPAWLAAVPRLPGPGNAIAGGEGTLAALRNVWPMWMLFTAIAVAIWIGGRRWLRPMPNLVAGGWLSRRQLTILLSMIGGLWVLLFWNNAVLFPFFQGFDSQDHLAYIKYVQERHALPLPTEGFEMFQPPLYYALSAIALSLSGLSVDSHAGILVLRFLTVVFGILQFALVFLSLRLFFPHRLTAQFVGLVLAAFLPMQLYLSHYVTNETLGATLVTASAYLGLRLLRTKDPSVAQFVWLGLCMGAAMLAKTTALLLVAPLFLALVFKLAVERAPAAFWLRHFGAMSLAFATTCGWHYFRIWRRFGTPLLGNWDEAAGFSWWQDPGFHTGGDYLRFGKSLVTPLYSGFWSFADGIYSTLWGDGLSGGVPNLAFRPPWNYDLMIAGYLLALVPTLIVLVGTGTALWRFVRKPSTEWFVLIGFTGAVAFGVIYMTLKVACYGQEKAFYGLALLVPVCFFGAVGWEVLTRGRQLLAGALSVLLLVWAMNSFGSYWIVRSAPQHVYASLRWGAEDNVEAATAEATKAVEVDPSNASARGFLALLLINSGRAKEALSQVEQAVQLSPMNSACHLRLGMVLAQQGQMEPAVSEARRALELGPEDLFGYIFLQDWVSKLGRDEEAIDVAREGLAVAPFNADLHQALGVALAQKEEFVPAAHHFVYALLLRPDFPQARSNFRVALRLIGKTSAGSKHLQDVASFAPDAPAILNEMAWLFATESDGTLRDGTKAVRLAERASALTNRPGPTMLATLAAAYAEAGRMREATKIAEEAHLQAQSSSDADMIKLTEKLLAAFEAGQAYHEEAK